MRAKDALELLGITQATLGEYVKRGHIRATILPSGRRDYDDESIYQFIDSGIARRNFIYGRISPNLDIRELDAQIKLVQDYCQQNNIRVSNIYRDIASESSLDDKREFSKIVDATLTKKIGRIIILHKSVIMKNGFEFFENLFDKFGTKIEVVQS